MASAGCPDCADGLCERVTDGGTWRRLVVINFVSKFVDKPSEPHHYLIDETIQHKVNSGEWGTAFLAFLVHTLKEGKGFHKLYTPNKVLEYTSEYRNENDGIAKFITEKIGALEDGDEANAITVATLRSVFKQWKMANDQMTLTIKEMEARITAL